MSCVKEKRNSSGKNLAFHSLKFICDNELYNMVFMTQWFDVILLNPDEEIAIYAIQEPGHSEEVISYLVVGKEKALLIDTGMGIGNIKKIVDGIVIDNK